VVSNFLQEDIDDKNWYDNNNAQKNGLNGHGKFNTIYNWAKQTHKDKTVRTVEKKIFAVCRDQNIPKNVLDTAIKLHLATHNIYHKIGKRAGNQLITRGINRAAIIAACLLLSCDKHDQPRSISEIATYFELKESDVTKGKRSLYNILETQNIDNSMELITPTKFIQRKCDELGISKIYTDKSLIIADNIVKLNIATTHTTYSLAAASIRLMAEMNDLKHITKKNISSNFGKSQVTIDKTYDRIKPLKHILIDSCKVDKIVEFMDKSDKLIINLEVFNLMTRFNIDTSKYTCPINT
jgi:transcription initiation factor TFIIIB Brf1 subunit/transcription initiation factor TFIIB